MVGMLAKCYSSSKKEARAVSGTSQRKGLLKNSIYTISGIEP